MCGESVEDTRYQQGYLWMKILCCGGKSGASPLVKRQKDILFTKFRIKICIGF